MVYRTQKKLRQLTPQGIITKLREMEKRVFTKIKFLRAEGCCERTQEGQEAQNDRITKEICSRVKKQ